MFWAYNKKVNSVVEKEYPFSSLKIMPLAMSLLVFASAIGIWWDRWWHLAVGRHWFWIPPHLLIIIPALLSGLLMVRWFGRLENGSPERKFALGFLAFTALFFLSVAFDESWHRWFGGERVDSVLILWSWPHIFMAANLVLRAFVLIGFFDRLGIFEWHRVLVYGAALANADFMLKPFYTFDIYRYGGPLGIAIPFALFAAVLLYAKRARREEGAFLIAAAYLMAVQFGTTSTFAPGVPLPQHVQEFPQWVRALSYLSGSALIDLFFPFGYAPAALGALFGLAAGAAGIFSAMLVPERIVAPLTASWNVLIVLGGIAGGVLGSFLARLRFEKIFLFMARHAFALFVAAALLTIALASLPFYASR